MAQNQDLGLHLHLNSLESSASSLQEAERMKGTHYVNIFPNGVAVMSLIGPIYPRANLMTMSGAVSISQFTNDFIRAYESDNVKAIVFEIDSPGGDVRGIGDASEIIYNITKKGKKPVKAFASGYMASAAYYVGSTAREIIASKSAIVGSIGVVMTARAKGKDEIEITSSQSPNKRLDPAKDEDVARIRQRLDDLADIFISDVATFRNITPDRVLSHYGQGDVFIGPRAKKQGLIDRIGTLSSVVNEAAKEAMGQSRGRTRQSYEAIDGSVPSILKFTEEDTMGFKDFITKFKTSSDTVLDAEAQDAELLQESDESADASSETQGTPVTTEREIEAVEEGAENVATRESLEAQFSDSAELFAVTLTMDSKIYPSQQAHVASDLLNAKIDDALHGGSVTFINSEGVLSQGTREESVRARYNAMPKHTMTQESIKGVKDGSVVAKVLADVDPETVRVDGPLSEERKRELLGTSELGQRVLAQKK